MARTCVALLFATLFVTIPVAARLSCLYLFFCQYFASLFRLRNTDKSVAEIVRLLEERLTNHQRSHRAAVWCRPWRSCRGVEAMLWPSGVRQPGSAAQLTEGGSGSGGVYVWLAQPIGEPTVS